MRTRTLIVISIHVERYSIFKGRCSYYKGGFTSNGDKEDLSIKLDDPFQIRLNIITIPKYILWNFKSTIDMEFIV